MVFHWLGFMERFFFRPARDSTVAIVCVARGFLLLLLNLVFIIPGVIERWELIQAQALSKELRMKQNLQQWQQFNSDLNSIWAWLGETEEELEKLRHLDLSTDIRTIELRIKKLKVSFISLFHELFCRQIRVQQVC